MQCAFPVWAETWIFIVSSYSHTHLITRFPQGKITDCYSLRLWTVCGLCRCCSASSTDFAQLTSDQVTQGNKPRFRITIFSSFSVPWAATTQRNDKLKRAWTYTQTDSHEKLKTETALRATMSQYANTVNMRVSQALGCAAFSKSRALKKKKKKINSRISRLCWIFKITPTTLILIGDRSCFALGVSSCRQVS